MPSTPTLAAALGQFKAAFAQRAAPERIATMEAATAQLRASGLLDRALAVGAPVPAVTLPDATGAPVELATLWRDGPAVLVFYRGGWCPYCNLELQAWQQHLPALHGLGARLAAVSPQTPDNSLSTAEKNALAYPVLSDSRLHAADAFGIAFDLPAELVALYAQVGHDLPRTNGNGRWALPVPATYVVGTDGRVAWRHVEVDYRERAEPQDVLDALARRGAPA